MKKVQNNNSERSKSPEKTAAILRGAMQEFLVNGYAATSMDKVAKAAQVSKATVYSHFGDKESLFGAVIQDLAQDKFQAVMKLEKPELLSADPQQVLAAMATTMLNNAKNDYALQNFIRIIIGESGRFPELAQVYVNNVAKPAMEALSTYFKVHPALKLEDPEATARVMMGTLVYYVMLQEMLHGKDIIPLSIDRIVQTITNMIVREGK